MTTFGIQSTSRHDQYIILFVEKEEQLSKHPFCHVSSSHSALLVTSAGHAVIFCRFVVKKRTL